MSAIVFRASRFISADDSRIALTPQVGMVVREPEVYDHVLEMHERLKRLELKAVPWQGAIKYFEIVAYGSLCCYKCFKWFLPEPSDVAAVVENGGYVTASAFECPHCGYQEAL